MSPNQSERCCLANNLDQFYTNVDVVEKCLEGISFDDYDIVLEPSAGSGSFLNLLPKDKRQGLDLEPAHDEVIKQDFFDFVPDSSKKYYVVGNPPFGKNSSLAVKFFNKSAIFADKIAFIIPRTFRKPSLINRLDENFHLIRQEILPLNSFHTPSGVEYGVPTVFQVWSRKLFKREKLKTVTEHPDFDFVKIRDNPTIQQKREQCANSDFCIRRVGAAAGKVYEDYGEKYRDWKSHYYIKQNIDNVGDIFQSIEWDYLESPKYDTAGNPSISKNDLIRAYIEKKKEWK